jgi:hypothetical protein
MTKRFVFILGFLTLASCQTKNDIDYVAKCELLCDDEKGKFLDIEKLKKYRKWRPYDTVQNVRKDSIFISFDFITDCCLDFSGSVEITQDTLKLLYGYPPADTLGPCDCYCDYRMIYKIKNDNLSWSTLKISNTDGHKPY